MHVLQIEADETMAQDVECLLKSEKFVVSTTRLGQEAIDLLRDYDHDIITLNPRLPDMSGPHFLRVLRRRKVHTPILVLSDKADVDTKVKALDAGADDYLTHPLEKRELVARIQALVRRSKGHAHSVIVTGNLSVDISKRVVNVGGKRFNLTTAEFRILELLSLRKGSLVTRDTLMDHLYGGLNEPQENVIDRHIYNLRKKIAEVNYGNSCIETFRNGGFILHDPIDMAQAAE